MDPVKGSYLVTSAPEHRECTRLIDRAVIRDRRLPQQVFREPRRFWIREFDDVFGTELWEAIRSACAQSGDAEIVAATIDPEPEYYARHVGYFGTIRFSLDDPAQAWLDVLTHEPPENAVECFAYHAMVIVAAAHSQRWALWAERNMGVFILSADASIDLSGAPVEWMPAEEALRTLVALEFRNQIVPPEIAAEFLRNFG